MKNILDGMKRIENQEDMLRWARAINSGLMREHDKCDYQDVWAHSDQKTLDDLFMACNGDRKLVLCSVYNTMSYDEVERLLLHYGKVKGTKLVNDAYAAEMVEVNKMRGDVYKRENALTASLKTYWKRITALKRDNSFLQSKCDRLQKDNNELTQMRREYRLEIIQLRERADKYDAIKSLLA